MKRIVFWSCSIILYILCTIQFDIGWTIVYFVGLAFPTGLFFRSKAGVWPWVFSILLLRLFVFQRGMLTDLEGVGCGQGRQVIDSVISVPMSAMGTIYSAPNKRSYIFVDDWGRRFNVATTGQYQNATKVQILGTIVCHGIKPAPFSRESGYIARGYIGTLFIEKMTFLSHRDDIDANQTIPCVMRLALGGELEGIAEGIVRGDTSFMSKETYQYFIDSGLVYLVSASGGNIILLIYLASYIFFFVPVCYRRYAYLVLVIGYFYILGENIAFLRACVSFILTIYIVPQGALKDPIRAFLWTLFAIVMYNPYLLVSSRGLALSASGVRGIIHTPYVLQKNHYLKYIAGPLCANIALTGPLLFLTQHTNLLVVFLSVLAAPIANCIAFLYIASHLHIPYMSDIIFYVVKALYVLAKRGATTGVFISLGHSSNAPALLIRITSRILLSIVYNVLHKRYFASIRD